MNFSCVHLPAIVGNGKMTSSERTLPPFEKIRISGSAEVRFHASQEYRAVITVDSNIEEYVILKTINKTLNIDLRDERSYSYISFIVDVYCPSISGISISGSGKFEGADKIIAETFESKISGYGKIDGDIECDTLSVNISGSGEINITGTSKEADVNISGSGNFNGTELQNNRVVIHVSGSGNISIWVLEYLKVNVSGSGNIKYRGNPKIDYSASGSGRLISE
jgi:hypothetical protein